jgi:hypothetical protein
MHYLLTYMALHPRFGQGMSEKNPPLYSISSKVHPVTGFKNPAIAVHAWTPALYRALCGKSLSPLIMCPAWSNQLLFTTSMTFGLMNSLSSSKLYLLLYTTSTIFGPNIVGRTFLSKRSNRFSFHFVSTHVSLPNSMTGQIMVL